MVRSASARSHSAQIAARTRRINRSKADPKPHKSAKQVKDENIAKGLPTRDDLEGTVSFRDTDIWSAPDVMIDTADARRTFVHSQSKPGRGVSLGNTVWMDFRLASAKAMGGVSPVPELNDILYLKNKNGSEIIAIQIDKLSRSVNRRRTGACLCRILDDSRRTGFI